MGKKWVKIYSTGQVHKAEIVKSILEDSDFECVVMNKMDSSYNSFGEVEVYTLQENVLQAINILKKHPI